MVLGNNYNGSVLLTQADGTLRRVDTAHLRNTINNNRAHADNAHKRINAVNTNVTNHWNHNSAQINSLNGRVNSLDHNLKHLTNTVNDANTTGSCVLRAATIQAMWGNPLAPGAIVLCSKIQHRSNCTGNCEWVPR